MKKVFVGIALCAIVFLPACGMLADQLVGTWSNTTAGVTTTVTFTSTRFTQSTNVPLVGPVSFNCDYTATSDRIPNTVTFSNCSLGGTNGSVEYIIIFDTLTLNNLVYNRQ